MNTLNILQNMGFKITWKLINIGLFGNDELSIMLSRDDVFDYIENSLTSINESIDDFVSVLCQKDDFDKFDSYIKKFANTDTSNVVIQKRKWRAYLLKKIVDNANQDCLQGLLELMEFWVSMSMPDNCPLDFPKSNDSESKQNYFTRKSYEFNLNKNRAWLEKEILSIIESEESVRGF